MKLNICKRYIKDTPFSQRSGAFIPSGASEAPLGYAGTRGAWFGIRPRAWSVHVWCNAGICWGPPVTSYLDVLSLGSWPYPSAVSVSFCVLGSSQLFLALLSAFSCFGLDHGLFPCPLCCLLLPETTLTGPLWEEQTEVSGTRGAGFTMRQAWSLTGYLWSLFFKTLLLRWYQALPLSPPACPPFSHSRPHPPPQPWFISSVEPSFTSQSSEDLWPWASQVDYPALSRMGTVLSGAVLINPLLAFLGLFLFRLLVSASVFPFVTLIIWAER